MECLEGRIGEDVPQPVAGLPVWLRWALFPFALVAYLIAAVVVLAGCAVLDHE
jgi:hypothetical protein